MNNMVGFDWCLGFFNAIAGTYLMVSCKVRNLNNYLRGSWLIWVFLKWVWIFWAGVHTLAFFANANCCVIFNSVCWNALGPMFAVKIELFVPWICRFKVIMHDYIIIIIIIEYVGPRRASGFFSDSLFESLARPSHRWPSAQRGRERATAFATTTKLEALEALEAGQHGLGYKVYPRAKLTVDSKKLYFVDTIYYCIRLRIYIFGGW